MKKKTTSIQMAPDIRELVMREAKAERRSVSSMINIILQKYFDAKSK